MKYIAVFCSAQDISEKYSAPAVEFSRLLASNGYGLVWGGTDVGLMRSIAEAVREGGGKLIGVSMEILKHLIRDDVDEKIIAKDLSERKSIMLERCDGVVMLVGGIGTLDEITDVLALKKHELHNKPVVVLNTENFYEGLRVQLQKMKDDGFITKKFPDGTKPPMPLDELLYFADTPDEAIEFLKKELQI